MSKFHSVVNEFSALISDYQYAPLFALWPHNAISLCRVISGVQNSYCYVVASANKDGGLSTDLWIGPVNSPDSTLESNCGAFRIPIGLTYDEDADFFSKCEKRIIHLLPEVYSIAHATQREICTPTYISTTPTSARRMMAYSHYLETYAALKKHPLYESLLQKSAIEIYTHKKKNLSSVINATKKIMPDIFDSLSDDVAMFLSKQSSPPFDTYTTLAELCYIDTAATFCQL
ncbi:Imm25 family immunity protein [Pseudomonas putida]